MLNSKQKGNITEVEVMLEFLKQGYNVLSPYGDCERYDFVVDINNKFYRIQVKTSREGRNTANQIDKFCFSTSSVSTKNGKKTTYRYTKEEIDFFATCWEGEIYLIPVEECPNREKSLRLLPCKNGQTKGIYWAKDYKLEVVLETLR